MRLGFVGALVLTLGLASAGGAQAESLPLPVKALPIPLPSPLTPADFGIDREPACLAIYLNESNGTTSYLPVGAGVELADDLHAASPAVETLCAFDFGYFKPSSGFVDALVTLYENLPGDPDPGPVVAGPYLISRLPDGLRAFRIEVPPGSLIAGDVWLGVAFSDSETGLLAFGPPTLGSSHDRIWINPPGAQGDFGGGPPANLYLGMHTSPTTPTRAETWGSIKAIYR
ncbi:MAG: hypothetical protein ACREOU_10680 [Candidatus Eiseniibacteriota bacterium]